MRHPTLLNIMLTLGIILFSLTSFCATQATANDRVLLNMSNIFVDNKNEAIFKLNLKVGDLVSLQRLKPFVNNKGIDNIYEVNVFLVSARNKASRVKMVEKRPVPISTGGLHELIITTKNKRGIQLDFRVALLNAPPIEPGTSYNAVESSNIFIGIKDVFGKREQISKDYGLDSYRGKFPTIKLELEAGDVLSFQSNERKGLSNLKYAVPILLKEGYAEDFKPITIDKKDTYTLTFFLEVEDIDKKGWFGLKGKQKIEEARSFRSFSHLKVSITKANKDGTPAAKEDPMAAMMAKMAENEKKSQELMEKRMASSNKAQQEAMELQQKQQEELWKELFKTQKIFEVVTPVGGGMSLDLSSKMALNAKGDCICRRVKWDADATIYTAWLGVGEKMEEAYEQREKENVKYSGGNVTTNDIISDAIKKAYKEGGFSQLKEEIKYYYPSHELEDYKQFFSEMVEFALVDETNRTHFEKKETYNTYSGVGGFTESSLTISQPTEQSLYLCARNNNLYTPIKLLFKFQPFKILEKDISVMGGGAGY